MRGFGWLSPFSGFELLTLEEMANCLGLRRRLKSSRLSPRAGETSSKRLLSTLRRPGSMPEPMRLSSSRCCLSETKIVAANPPPPSRPTSQPLLGSTTPWPRVSALIQEPSRRGGDNFASISREHLGVEVCAIVSPPVACEAMFPLEFLRAVRSLYPFLQVVEAEWGQARAPNKYVFARWGVGWVPFKACQIAHMSPCFAQRSDHACSTVFNR